MFVVLIIAIIILGGVVAYLSIAPKLNPFNKAEAFLKQNMVKDAVIEYKRILEKRPHYAVAHAKLADIFFKQGKVDQAVLHLEKILDIDSYNYQIEKIDIQRKLAKAYFTRDEIEKSFQLYFEIARVYPGDIEALYHVSFVLLGQEYYDMAYKFFNRLTKVSPKSFEIYFGAAMSSYQDHQVSEAVELFKAAVNIEPHSDVANIAMAFAQWRKLDFKLAVKYARHVVDSTQDQTASFIAKRILALMLVKIKDFDSGLTYLQDLKSKAEAEGLDDELSVILYDLGFAALIAEKTNMAYEYWNELYQHDKNYKNVQSLITMLRKEMDTDHVQNSQGQVDSVLDYTDSWMEETFPANFLWNICGLKSNKKINLRNILLTARTKGDSSSPPPPSSPSSSTPTSEGEKIYSDRFEEFLSTDVEKFRIMANRIVQKLGYEVDEILMTYRDSDGVDFLAHSLANKASTLVWVRRWRGALVGEIPLRNFAQEINDHKCKEGLFITTSEFTASGESALSNLSKVKVVYPEQVADILSTIKG